MIHCTYIELSALRLYSNLSPVVRARTQHTKLFSAGLEATARRRWSGHACPASAPFTIIILVLASTKTNKILQLPSPLLFFSARTVSQGHSVTCATTPVWDLSFQVPEKKSPTSEVILSPTTICRPIVDLLSIPLRITIIAIGFFHLRGHHVHSTA